MLASSLFYQKAQVLPGSIINLTSDIHDLEAEKKKKSAQKIAKPYQLCNKQLEDKQLTYFS